MKIKVLIKKTIAYLLCVAVALTFVPITPAFAENTTRVSVGTASVTAGNTSGYIYVYAEGMQGVSGMEVSIYYDADNISVTSVAKYGIGSTSDCVADINDNKNGEIKGAFAWSGQNGQTSESGYLMRIRFQTTENTKVGEYPLSIAIGDVYDYQGSSITVSKSGGKLTVNSRPASQTSANFYSRVSSGNGHQGDTVTYKLMANGIGTLAGGSLIFCYDKDLLKLENTQTASEIAGIASVNDGQKGRVKVSFVKANAIGSVSGPMVTLTFSIIKDETAYTSIDFAGEGLIAADLSDMTCNNFGTSVYLYKTPTVETHPFIEVAGNGSINTHEFSLDILADGTSNLAAGDFTVTYDADKIECVSAEADSSIEDIGAMLITKEEIDKGTVKFSFVCSEGISANQKLIKMSFNVKKHSGSTIAVSVSKPVTADRKGIEFECKSKTITVPAEHSYVEWQTVTEKCTENGVKQRTCAICENIDYGTIGPSGHDKVHVEKKPGSLSQDGNQEYWYCNRCEKYYKDDACTTEISQGETVIPQIGEIKLNKTDYEYSGNPIEPDITISDKSGVPLDKGTDYDISCTGNTMVGEAKATIEFCGDYSGTVEKKFNVIKSPKLRYILNETDKMSDSKIRVEIGNKSNIIVCGTGDIKFKSSNSKIAAVTWQKTDHGTVDATVTGKAAGDAKITVSSPGDQNYEKAQAVIDVFVPKNISSVKLKKTSATYNTKEQMPAIKAVYYGKKTLKSSYYAYELVDSKKNPCTSCKNSGTYYVKVRGTGSYGGTVYAKYTIKKASGAVSVSKSSMTLYTGKEGVKISASGKEDAAISFATTKAYGKYIILTDHKDGTATVAGGKTPGTAKITVKAAATDNYNAASKTITVFVKKSVNINSSNVTSVAAPRWNGSDTVAPEVTVKSGTTTYKASGNYTVDYEQINFNENQTTGDVGDKVKVTVTANESGDRPCTGTYSTELEIKKALQSVTVNNKPSYVKLNKTKTFTISPLAEDAKIIGVTSNKYAEVTPAEGGGYTIKGKIKGTAKITVQYEGTTHYEAGKYTFTVPVK